VIYPGLGIPTIPTWSGAPQIIEVFYSGLGFNPDRSRLRRRPALLDHRRDPEFQGHVRDLSAQPRRNRNRAALPGPVADSVPGTLTIGTQNMLHFFNNVADGADTSQYTDNCAGTGASDSCPTAAQYQTRLAKMSKQIREVLKAPVALGVEEVENYGVLSDLANRVFHRWRSALPAVHDPRKRSRAASILGVLVRSDVIVNSVTQSFKGSLTNSCSSNPPVC
jgi:hypothetical protein